VIAAAGLSAIGQIQAGAAQSRAAKYNSALDEQNAAVSRSQAAADADIQKRESYRRMGAIRAAYGAAGITTEGSPLDVLTNSAEMAELDRQNIIYKGEVRATGYENDAALERARGKAAMTAGYFGAASSLLKGGAGAAGMMGGGAAGGGMTAATTSWDSGYGSAIGPGAAY